MKKILFIAAAALLGLTACTEDYKDWTPQAEPTQPTIVKFADGSVTEMGVINLNDITDAEVQVAAITAPTASAEGFEATYTITLGETTYPIEVSGLMAAEDLQTYVANMYGRRPVERDIPATITMWLSNGKTTVKTATSGTFQVKVVPEAPVIANNYYIIGGPNDWAESAASKAIKFKHSDKDVYEDPIFTVVFDAAAQGDTWFAIGSDEACDAIANNNDWSKLLGTVNGNGQSGNEGLLNFRYNLSDDASFMVPAGSSKIRVTIDMMAYSYKVEAVNISENYYLVGGKLDWGESAKTKAQKFVHSDKDVFDDPFFTIIVPANAGGDTWFAIGDDAACDAIANDNNWSLLYGQTAGNGQNDRTGSMAPRSALSDDGSFKVTTNAAMIKVVINMLDLTFEIFDVAPQYFMVGALPGWSPEGAQTAIFYPTTAATMSYTSTFPEGSNLKIWNKNDLGNWDKCYGSVVDNSTDATGSLVSSGAGAISVPGAGVYTLGLDLGTMTYTWTKLDNQSPAEYSKMGVIGDFNGWGGDVEMAQVTPHNWYVVTEVSEGGLKFRANGGWDINWGAELSVDESSFYGTGVGGGPNIFVPAGKYAFYMNDITGQFAIVAQ